MDDESRKMVEQVLVLSADTPVTCARCGRTIVMASDEFDEWVWAGQKDDWCVCAGCATDNERTAHEAQPIIRRGRLIREVGQLTEDDRNWTHEKRAASEARMVAIVCELHKLI
jgi:hypothetical protein